MRRLTILFPARDEADGIAIVKQMIPFSKLAELGWQTHLVLVDGRSKDGTREVARELGIQVIEQRGEEGKGVGLRQAFADFLARGDDTLVMLDPDGTYDAGDIPLLLERLYEGEYDLVIGSRLRGDIDDGAMGRFNYVGNHLLTWTAVALYRNFISDLCTGFWAFRREAIAAMKLNSVSFEIEAEMYTACCHNQLNIGEVPIRYHKRIGQPKLSSVNDGLRIMRKLLVRRFFPTPVHPTLD